MAQDTMNQNAAYTADAISKAKDAGREAVNKGYDQAREYADKGMDYVSDMSDGVTEYVREQPWLAMAGAFLVGYVIARMINRL